MRKAHVPGVSKAGPGVDILRGSFARIGGPIVPATAAASAAAGFARLRKLRGFSVHSVVSLYGRAFDARA